MTATEQLSAFHSQLNAALLRKEELTSELAGVELNIRALRNAIEGAKIGANAAYERVAELAKAQESPPPETGA